MNYRYITIPLLLFFGLSLGCLTQSVMADNMPLMSNQTALSHQTANIEKYIAEKKQLAAPKQALKRQAYQNAYNNRLQAVSLFSPQDIFQLRIKNQAIKKAAKEPLYQIQSIIKTEKLYVNSANIKQITVAPGYFAVIAFYDSTGAPWPIDKVAVANQTFKVNIIGSHQNQLTIGVSKAYINTNLIVSLKNVDSLIVMNLFSNKTKNDSNIKYIVPEIGPNGTQTTGDFSSILSNTDDDILLQFLTGIAPPNAKEQAVFGMDGQAWRYKKYLYIRTDSYLRSPAWLSSRTAGSTHVYKLSPVSELLFAKDGHVENVSISEGDLDQNQASMEGA